MSTDERSKNLLLNSTYPSVTSTYDDISLHSQNKIKPTKRSASNSLIKDEYEDKDDDEKYVSLINESTAFGYEDMDDLEFLHDFLEHENSRPWFEANFFRCNCRNTSILFLLLCLVLAILYIFWFFYNDYISAHLLKIIKLSTIPIICIIFTYGHIALALWMTFWPVEFFGIYQFKTGPIAGYGIGWQGIVPMKAVEMAQISVDLMVPDVVRMEDVVAKIDPEKVYEILQPALLKILQIIIPRVAAKQAPIGWALLPEPVKQKMVEVAMADSPNSVKAMLDDINENIEEIFDLKQFIGDAFHADKELLSRIFEKCGRKELIFIRNFGAFLGLVFGLGQMFANMYFQGNYWFDHLMLPVSGFVLGWITNWVALTLIFRPINPIDIYPFCWVPFCRINKYCIRVQGLFLKRQREVSVEFAGFVTTQILRAENILAAMFRGPSSDRLFSKITKHLQDACDRFAGYEKFKPIIEFAIGTENFNQAKQEVVDGLYNCLELECSDEIVKVQKKLEEYTDEAMDIERLLRTKMAALSSKEFEGVLHPVFEQDEIKLIVIGAMLGLEVGLLQVYVIGN